MSTVAAKKYWTRSETPGLTMSGKHAYGEPTAGALGKIWAAIGVLHPTDVFLDWGMGAGKMLLTRDFFTAPLQLRGIGIEVFPETYFKARRNRRGAPLTQMQLADSSHITSWEPATIVMQYDGGTQPDMDPIHQIILTRLMKTRTVRIIFSTKMNHRLFLTYCAEGGLDPESWTMKKIPRLPFGGSTFMGHLWTRVSPLPPPPGIIAPVPGISLLNLLALGEPPIV
jgi:hypothetical protein